MANALRTKAWCPCRETTDWLLMNPLMVVIQHCCWYTVLHREMFCSFSESLLFIYFFFIFFLFLCLIFHLFLSFLFFCTEVKFLMTITPRWLMRGMERKWRQKSKVDKQPRKGIHMFNLRPVKTWEFNKCLYPWRNNLLDTPLNSLLLLSHHPSLQLSSHPPAFNWS